VLLASPLEGDNNAKARYDISDMSEAVQQKKSDNCILQRMAVGDRSALKQCLDAYGRLVWSVVCRFCPRPDEREDAVQEILMEIWRSAGRYKPEIASEATFVSMIARRRMIDRIRKNERQPILTNIDDQLELSSNGLLAEHNAELMNVDQALSTLTADQQKTIKLSVVQGYSHAQIAQLTDIPIGTVKTHIRRGLIQLRDRLKISSGPSNNSGGVA